jgi:plasmid stabilization system protein ParE
MASSAIDVHPKAIADAQQAYHWYRKENDNAAKAFRLEVERAIDLISKNPLRWPAYLHGTRRYLLKRFPFSIVYRHTGPSVQILAVAHGRRKPGYWRQR